MLEIEHRLNYLPRWLRFAMVGGLGFTIDSSILALGVHVYGIDPFSGRAISFSCAIVITWLLNRWFTFRLGIFNLNGQEFVRYLVSGLLGLGINIGIYLKLISEVPLTLRYPVLALVLSSASAAMFNYWSNLHFVFNNKQRKNAKRSAYSSVD